MALLFMPEYVVQLFHDGVGWMRVTFTCRSALPEGSSESASFEVFFFFLFDFCLREEGPLLIKFLHAERGMVEHTGYRLSRQVHQMGNV